MFSLLFPLLLLLPLHPSSGTIAPPTASLPTLPSTLNALHSTTKVMYTTSGDATLLDTPRLEKSQLLVQSFDDYMSTVLSPVTASSPTAPLAASQEVRLSHLSEEPPPPPPARSSTSPRRRLAAIESENPDFYLYQPALADLVAFGNSVSAAEQFLGWSQMKYGFGTNAPNDVTYDYQRSTYRARVSQKEYDISQVVGEIPAATGAEQAYATYDSSMYGNKLLMAGGRGAVVSEFVPDPIGFNRHGHTQTQLHAPLKQIDLKIDACAMGDSFFVLGGYTFADNDEDTPVARQVRVYRGSTTTGAWELEKTVELKEALANGSAVSLRASLAAAPGLFFVGNPGEQSVRVYRENSQRDGWTPAVFQLFGGLGERATSDGGEYGKTLAYSDGVLVVGAPSSTPHSSHVTDGTANSGSVFVYRIEMTPTQLRLTFLLGLNAPADYLQSHLIQAGGLLFGASVALSDQMEEDTYFLFVGAPGSHGTAVARAANQKFDAGGGGMATFTLELGEQPSSEFTHWFTGFLGQDDHDAGASVTYSDHSSMLFYGAPMAINHKSATNPLHGSGRVYIAAFCKQNEEEYSYLRYQRYLKKCRQCKQGAYSQGGRTKCTLCTKHPHTMGEKPSNAMWDESKSCVWQCNVRLPIQTIYCLMIF